MKALTLLLTAFLILTGCGTTDQVNNGRFVQKRKYNPGYAWRLGAAKVQNPVTDFKEKSDVFSKKLNSAKAEGPNQKIQELERPNIADLNPRPAALEAEDCDKIVFVDGTETKVHVLEVKESGVAYKLCGNKESGDIFVKPLEDVHRVVYANGTSMLFNDLSKPLPKVEEEEESPSENAEKRTTNGTQNGEKSEAYLGLSQIVAFLLCLFLGYIGIHRFYLGYIGIGIFQVVTLGCFGIWTLIDLIRICTGHLKPMNYEDYEETF